MQLVELQFNKLNEDYTIVYYYEIRKNNTLNSKGKGSIDNKTPNEAECSITCYPNPVRDIVHFEFNVREQSHIQLDIFNMQVHKIRTLINRNMLPLSIILFFQQSFVEILILLCSIPFFWTTIKIIWLTDLPPQAAFGNFQELLEN